MHIRHPLSQPEYLELIHEADIGLLMYDARRYYSRHAGVLGEYLSAGVPVIVPAGCWLSDQIEQEIQTHLDQLRPSIEPSLAPILESPCLPGQQATDTRGTFNDVQPLHRRWRVPGAASDVLVGFQIHRPASAGTYARLAATQLDAEQRAIRKGQWISPARAESPLTRALFHLDADCVSLELEWSNAYDCLPLTVSAIRLEGLPGDRVAGGQFPSGSVGLAAATPADVPELLADMHRHYAHYRRSSSNFSDRWYQTHKPDRTLQALLSNSQSAREPYRARSA
jgi:hypothetical protein